MSEITVNTEQANNLEANQVTPEALQAKLAEQEAAKSPDKKPEEKLYAGKYKTPEELEKGYEELSKKLGTKPADSPTDKQPEDLSLDLSEDAATEAVSNAGFKMEDLADEYKSNNGDLKEETYVKLEKAGISREMVGQYIEGQKALAEKFVNTVLEDVGGREGYAELTKWAIDNLSDAEKKAYNTAVNSGDAESAKLAIAGLKAKMENVVGKSPDYVRGRSDTTNDAFKSDAEIRAAMKDPRYIKDPAYTADVRRRIAAMG